MHAGTWALAIALALSTGSVAAQDKMPATGDSQAQATAPAAVDPHKAAVIRDLMEVTGATALGLQMADTLIESERKTNPDIDSAFWKQLRDKVQAQDMAALLMPVYDRHFSTADLEALLAFYRSPPGQRVLHEMPAVMKESLALGQEWGKQLAQQLLKELQDERAAGKTKRM